MKLFYLLLFLSVSSFAMTDPCKDWLRTVKQRGFFIDQDYEKLSGFLNKEGESSEEIKSNLQKIFRGNLPNRIEDIFKNVVEITKEPESVENLPQTLPSPPPPLPPRPSQVKSAISLNVIRLIQSIAGERSLEEKERFLTDVDALILSVKRLDEIEIDLVYRKDIKAQLIDVMDRAQNYFHLFKKDSAYQNWEYHRCAPCKNPRDRIGVRYAKWWARGCGCFPEEKPDEPELNIDDNCQLNAYICGCGVCCDCCQCLYRTLVCTKEPRAQRNQVLTTLQFIRRQLIQVPQKQRMEAEIEMYDEGI